MSMYRFIPADGSQALEFRTLQSFLTYKRETFPGSIVYGTSVNDGQNEHGRLVAL